MLSTAREQLLAGLFGGSILLFGVWETAGQMLLRPLSETQTAVDSSRSAVATLQVESHSVSKRSRLTRRTTLTTCRSQSWRLMGRHWSRLCLRTTSSAAPDRYQIPSQKLLSKRLRKPLRKAIQQRESRQRFLHQTVTSAVWEAPSYSDLEWRDPLEV